MTQHMLLPVPVAFIAIMKGHVIFKRKDGCHFFFNKSSKSSHMLQIKFPWLDSTVVSPFTSVRRDSRHQTPTRAESCFTGVRVVGGGPRLTSGDLRPRGNPPVPGPPLLPRRTLARDRWSREAALKTGQWAHLSLA